MDFSFYYIIKFLKQAHGKTSLAYANEYPREYKELKPDYGFGSGNHAKVPYISFLGYEQETRKGIYPVLLYYRENNYLIVAYGVSATEGPGPQWVFDDMKLTIGDYSQENNNILGNTPTYGESYLHAAFQVDPNEDNFGLNETELMNALDTVIEKFHKQFSQLETENDTGDAGKKIVENFLKYAKSINFQIEEDLILRYVGSLLSKPFVILTGLSGSGKSKLAQIFVK